MAKSKLNREIIEHVRKLASLGVDVKTITDALNISRQTFYDWLNRGERDAQEGKRTLYADFFDAYKKAQAEAIIRNVALILEAAKNGNWQAAAWFLERRMPEVWGRKLDVHSEGKFEVKIKLVEGEDDAAGGNKEDLAGA